MDGTIVKQTPIEAEIANNKTSLESQIYEKRVILKGGHSPIIGDNGNWYEWDNGLQQMVDTGVQAEGKDYVITEADKAEIRGGIDEQIGSLKSDLITKANQSDLDRTNDYLEALFKLNRGQTWDTQEAESNAYAVDVPSGTHYAGVDMIGGKSLVWNQLVNKEDLIKSNVVNGITITNNNDGSITLNGTATDAISFNVTTLKNFIGSILIKIDDRFTSDRMYYGTSSLAFYYPYFMYKFKDAVTDIVRFIIKKGATFVNEKVIPQIFNLTSIFGEGNEPSTVEEFEAMFPLDYYEYCEPTIISSQTDRVDVRGKNLFDINKIVPTNMYVENGELHLTPSSGGINNIKNGQTLRELANLEVGETYILNANSTYSNKVIYLNASGKGWAFGTSTVITQEDLDSLVGWYGNGAIISNIQIEKGTTATDYSPYSLQQIETGFPVLNEFDSIESNDGKLITGGMFVDLGTLNWMRSVTNTDGEYRFRSETIKSLIKPVSGTNIVGNLICDKYPTKSLDDVYKQEFGVSVQATGAIDVFDPAYKTSSANDFKKAMSGVMLYCELAEPVITDIEIPSELADWLTVEAGGSITFHNADDGKRLLIPNKETFIRKLDEVV